jgi:UDP-GlcNAc3NAcA epimerase
MKRLLTVIGARPQFIKASAVSQACKEQPGLHEILVHTGQHFDSNMSDIFFSELDMPAPAHNLDIHGGGHGEMTGRMLHALEKVLIAERPDAVLVYGDTNSTLAGALAAVKLHIPVAHVEAGLRSFNMAMPEEVNRILTDRISRWLFTPTEVAAEHLRREGVSQKSIFPVGDVMFDVALRAGSRVTADGGVLGELGLPAGGYCLATIHRAENTDDPLRLNAIVNGLAEVSRRMPVVWPMHPRTRETLRRESRLSDLPATLRLIDPIGYLDMVRLEKHAAVIATDSGGVQKEAFFYRVPCVTLRDETEWTELVESGWNRLIPPLDAMRIARGIEEAVGRDGIDVAPYGTGDAARRIVATLSAVL